MFKNEKEMQSWLSDKFKSIYGLSDLIDDYEEDISSVKINHVRIVETFKYCLESLGVNSVIVENENISLKEGDVLKPDFLLYAPETESIVIIELKNIANPTRQVGTELGAYCAEIKEYLPFICDGDIVNVVISQEWPTLLKHYLMNEILWLNRKILCLKPIMSDGEIRLKVIQSSDLIDATGSLEFNKSYLTGYQICLYDDELYRGGDRGRLSVFLPQLKTSIKAMSSKGIMLNGHGFLFLWKDHRQESLAPFSITIINIAPFESLDRIWVSGKNSVLLNRLLGIKVDHDPLGHGNSLHEIASFGFKFLEEVCSPVIEGFLNWDILKNIMLEDSELIEFHCWGVFLDYFNDKLSIEYQRGNLNVDAFDPFLALEMLGELIVD